MAGTVPIDSSRFLLDLRYANPKAVVNLSAPNGRHRILGRHRSHSRSADGSRFTTAGRLTDQKPAIVLTELGGSSVDWAVRVWSNTPEYWDVKQALIRSIKNSVDEAEIGIPYPTMDLNVNQPVTV